MSLPPDPNLPPVVFEDDCRLHPVYVIRPPRRRWWLHLLLFLATVFTTLVMGARLQYNFLHQLPPFNFDTDLFPLRWALSDPRNLLLGIPFSFTLLLILLAHELGHFLYCLRYRVHATLPFFVPAPTLIGTFGAFIRIQSPIPGRRALFDIGVAGPIAGFVVALPTLAFGLMSSKFAPWLVAESGIQFGYPLVFHLAHRLLPGAQYPLAGFYLDPIAVAAWVGMFATSLNLIPGGQLDGGHIVYAVAPRAHKYVSRLSMLALLPLGWFFWGGWLIWALVLATMGRRHPEVAPYPALDRKRRWLAAVALLLLLLTAVPAPFRDDAPADILRQYLEQR